VEEEEFMWVEQLRAKIEEQQEVYHALKEGDVGTVCYKEFQNGEWGTDDENYTNRLRLAYYLLYCHVEDEEAVVYLFQEELKDRENNSFQGIGSTLRILTWLLRKYNTDSTYAGLLKRAKNANFDCACGYDSNETVEEDLESNSLLDCIYICQEMEYRDVMGSLVDEWKRNTTEWNSDDRTTLIRFNTFLGRDAENEELYQKQLEEVLSAESGSAKDVISKYTDLIQYYLHIGDNEKALSFCKKVIETTDYRQIRSQRLFGRVLESCFEVTANDPAATADLWNWAKAQLQSMPQSIGYGNLYTKGIVAAKALKDPYEKELEQEYEGLRIQWNR